MENINEEKRKKFFEIAGKRVNNIIHDIEILKPMAKGSNYDYLKNDVENMFSAIQKVLDSTKEEYLRKFEEKIKQNNNTFSFENIENDKNENEEGGLE